MHKFQNQCLEVLQPTTAYLVLDLKSSKHSEPPELSAAAMSRKQALAELQQQIDNLRRREKRARARSLRQPKHRCSPQHARTLMVYLLGGHSSDIAVDFVLGRGWRHRWKQPCAASPAESRLKHEGEVAAVIEQAFMDAPMSALVAFDFNPLEHFEFHDLLRASKYVMEHNLQIGLQAKTPTMVLHLPVSR